VKMLLCENFRWRHKSTLRIVAHHQQHTNKSDNRLATPHITLEQTVHLLTRLQVCINFPDHLFLRPCELEGQVVLIKLCDQCGVVENDSLVLVFSYKFQHE